MKISRRSLIAAASVAAEFLDSTRTQAQNSRYPNWKPKLGVLGNFSDANLAFVKAEGFTSMELNLDPRRLDDAAVQSIKDKVRTAGIYISSLNLGPNHIDPDPPSARRTTSTPCR